MSRRWWQTTHVPRLPALLLLLSLTQCQSWSIEMITRRRALVSIATSSSCIVAPKISFAETASIPRAPTVDALIPATRQRALLRECIQIVEQASDTERLRQILPRPTDAVLRRRPNGMVGRSDARIAGDTTSTQLTGQTIRASCNVYTSKLQFGESYVLTAPPAERKRMIRDDALPDVKAVITADLDLRDLYRNTAQTNIDDAQAELYVSDEVDFGEMKILLQNAQEALDAWFALIRPEDVAEAEAAIAGPS